jgi:DeoR/GlpR family transcriptional regulator of sugar metabolism
MNERQQKILKQLDERGQVSITELSKEFGCSSVTVRNDIRELDKQDQLVRVHGGAVKKKIAEALPGMSAANSLNQHVEEKKQIVARAYEYIKDRDTLILDDSSTCYFLALHIKNHPQKRLAVLTNSLLSAIVLADCPHVELSMIGGNVGGHLAATMGDQASKSLKDVFVDKAFIGVHSVNFNVGITSVNSPQMQMKQAILRTTSQVYVLADSFKFGAGYLEVICPLTEVYKIITDDKISAGDVAKARQDNVPLEIAPAL